jgi:phosphoesterase RecJ-like protein
MESITGRTLLAHEHAVCIMGAILTDTGGFRFSNTTRETFMVASSLMQYDVDISALSYEMLESMTLAKYRLIGLTSEHARFFHNGRIAMLGVSRKMLEETGADEGDTNGLANMLRAIESVRVAFVLKEGEDGVVRVNIRSKEGFDAAAFASGYGGGGHTRAAGFNLEKTDLGSAESMLAEKAGEWLSRS